MLSAANATFFERFIENSGQWDGRAKFLLRTGGMNTWVEENGILYDFYTTRYEASRLAVPSRKGLDRRFQRGHVVKMEFLGAQTQDVRGQSELNGKANYFKNGVQQAMSSSVFNEARLTNVYPGIDTRVYTQGGKPRFDIIVGPAADPNQIVVDFKGATNLRVVNNGTGLQFDTMVGSKNVSNLFAYQVINGQQQQVQATFSIDRNGKVRYALGAYDPMRPLIIDPIVYSTLLGGPGADDIAFSCVVDGLTSAYVGGRTFAATFPTSIGAYDEIPSDMEGFVTKFLPDGSDVAYSSFIGGTDQDTVNGVAIDADLNCYIVGTSESADFDTTGGAFQTGNAGDFDMFCVKLNPTGTALIYSTLIGGTNFEQAMSVAVDQDGTAYVAGFTGSIDFPAVNGTSFMGPNWDGTVTAVSASGAALNYSSVVGGTDTMGPFNPEMAVSIAVDIDRNAYVLALTNALDAPTDLGVFDRTPNGLDNYVSKFQSNGTREFSTFVGGSGGESPTGIALDNTANIYITGATNSFNYPRTAAAFDRTYNLGTDTFVTKLNRLGTGLVYSTFGGTTGGAVPNCIAVDDIGFAHIAGSVAQGSLTAVNIPITANADDPTYNGPLPPNGGDAYLEVINDSGTALQYCSYIGGGADDVALGIGLDGARNAYVVGATASHIGADPAFPTTPGAYKEAFAPDIPPNFTDAFYDGFLVKVKTRIPLTIQSLVINPNAVASGQSTNGTVTISAPASTGGATVSLSNNNNSVVSTPATVLIPQGGTTASFQIDTTANLTTTQAVVITATIEGDSKSAMLTVSPWLTALTLSNDTVVGGNLVGGRITIFTAAPAGGVTVNMASTVPTVATVPTTVTVPAGLNTVTFDVSTRGVIASQLVDITASYAGLTRTVTLNVIPARLVSLSFVPTVVTGGTSVTGKVQLNGSASDSGVIVALTSSVPAALSVPATVTVAPQTQSATFVGTTDVVALNTSVTVSATFGIDTVTAVVDVLRANLISLAVTPDVILGGNAAVGTVGLDAPAATGGVTIPLTSTAPGVASVPATVTIPSGSTNTNFTVQTSLVAVDTNVDISATRGAVTLTVTILVKRVEFSIGINPASVFGGQSAVGTVTLIQAAPPAGVTITLSSDTGSATVPASVFIAGGETAVTFNIGTTPVAADVNATITGGAGAATATANLLIRAPGPVNLTLNPTQVSGGQNSTGTVTLSGTAPVGGTIVTLSSNNAAATVPATVTVPQGSSSRTFTVTTTSVTATTIATITATANSQSANANLTIVGANLMQIRFLPSRVTGGQTTSMIIQLDAAAPPGGAVIALTNSNPLVATIPPSVTVPAGQTSVTTTVLTRRVSRTLATQVTATYNSSSKFAILTVTR